jgi:hypothetical protein
LIAGYMWDSLGEGSPVAPIRSALGYIGAPPPPLGLGSSSFEALSALFASCGLNEIADRKIELTMRFPDFGEFWRTHTPAYTSYGKVIASLSHADRERLQETLRTKLPAGADGSITCVARANAINARAPR